MTTSKDNWPGKKGGGGGGGGGTLLPPFAGNTVQNIVLYNSQEDVTLHKYAGIRAVPSIGEGGGGGNFPPRELDFLAFTY